MLIQLARGYTGVWGVSRRVGGWDVVVFFARSTSCRGARDLWQTSTITYCVLVATETTLRRAGAQHCSMLPECCLPSADWLCVILCVESSDVSSELFVCKFVRELWSHVSFATTLLRCVQLLSLSLSVYLSYTISLCLTLSSLWTVSSRRSAPHQSALPQCGHDTLTMTRMAHRDIKQEH